MIIVSPAHLLFFTYAPKNTLIGKRYIPCGSSACNLYLKKEQMFQPCVIYINKKRFVDRFNRQHFDKSGGFYTDKKLNRQTKKCQVNIA